MKQNKLTLAVGLAAVVFFLLLREIGVRIGFYLVIPSLFWVIVILIHLVLAVALFREIRNRRDQGIQTYLSLEPAFWALMGLGFGIIGLVAHWFFNDFVQKCGAQQTGDGNEGHTRPRQDS